MKLWHVTARDKRPEWEPWYDKAFAFVVRAETEAEARELAANCAGEEGSNPWLNSDASLCEILTPKGERGVIIKDFAAA
jgi:hypothetical protein